MASEEKTPPTFDFRDGVLHIEAPWATMRLRWCPYPRAEEKCSRTCNRWREFWPDFRLLKPDDEQCSFSRVDVLCSSAMGDDVADNDPVSQKAEAFSVFRCEIPPDVVSAVERFQSHQWALLKLMQRAETIRDLAVSNRALAYCLANSGELRGADARVAWQLAVPHSHAKQKEILEWLGFPGTQAMVKLTRRLLPEAVSPFSMRFLRSSITHDGAAIKLLTHQGTVNAGVLVFAANPRTAPLATPQLLSEIGNSENELADSPTADCLDNALLLLMDMEDSRTIRPFRSVPEVVQFHDEVAEEYEVYKERQAAARRERIRRRFMFSDPPIPGTETITPITSVTELKKEGREQKNCVASLERDIRNGKRYIYRVLSPQRATLAIHRAGDGCWRRGEIKRKTNKTVSQDTLMHVDSWLYQHSLSV